MLRVENLIGGYGKEVVKNISFHVEKESFLHTGPNGCGKSTLLKLLLRFIPKKSGRIFLQGQDMDQLHRKSIARIVSYIPQFDSMPFPYTVIEMVTMGRSCHLDRWKTPSKKTTVLHMNL